MNSEELSRATTSDLFVPCPDGVEYLPFQKAGIEYSLMREGTLIGDEMGLGKTVQAIGVCNAVNAKSILVICPSSLKHNWKKEMDKWLVRKLQTEIVTGKYFPYATNVLIINYDILRKYRTQLRQHTWDVLIADECHMIKSLESQRTREVVGYRADANLKSSIQPIPAKKKVFLTGTPILNRPNELWSIISYLNPQYWNSEFAFLHRYCKKGGFKGRTVTGGKNLGELQRKLRESVMVRRLKNQVLKDLPDKVRQIIEIEPNKEMSALIHEEKVLMREINQELSLLRTAVQRAEKTGDMEQYQEEVKKFKEMSGLRLGEMSKMRKRVALAKAPLMIKYLEEMLESTDKVVVFCHHREVMDNLKSAFSKRAVMVRGGMTDKDKDTSVVRFQEDPGVNIFIGSIKAAGVGLTLTASSTVVFAELDWVPANLLQAEDRCHRLGQKDSVLVQHFVLQDSLDANMAHKIVEKQNMIDKALDHDYLKYITEIPEI